MTGRPGEPITVEKRSAVPRDIVPLQRRTPASECQAGTKYQSIVRPPSPPKTKVDKEISVWTGVYLEGRAC